MKLPFFGNKKQEVPEDEMLLALDVGTRFIKTVVFRIEEGQVHVYGYARVPQQSNSMHSAMIVNLQNVISATDICVGKALAIADQKLGKETPLPKQAILGIAGELVKGVTIQADYERGKPDKKIKQEEVNEVVETVKEQMFTQIHTDIAAEMGLKPEQVEEIDTKVVAAYVDSVKLDNPLGFTGAKAEYSVYSTFAPSIHINSLKELAESLGLEILDIVVEPYAISRSVKNSHDQSYSAIFVDIGGGTTDIALVQNGAVMGTKMYAFGGQVFTKRLMVDMNLDMQKAEELKLDYTNQAVSEVKEKKIKESFAKDIPIWAEGLEISLGEFEDIKTYPDTLYFCGGGSMLPDIRAGLLSHPWLQVLPFNKFPKFEYIFPNQLEGLVDHTKKMIDPMDVAPASLALMASEKLNS